MSTLLIFKGHPGTGKSTLSQKITKETNWKMISRDEIKEQLLKEGVSLDFVGKQSYEILWQTLEDNLAAQISIICDININQPVALEHLARIQQKTKAQIIVVNCICSDEEEHQRRLNSRQNLELSGFWIDSWEKYQAYLKSTDNQGDYEVPYPTIEVDTSKQVSVSEVISQIRNIENQFTDLKSESTNL